jgi:2-dehydro-3-deoxygluconokinase
VVHTAENHELTGFLAERRGIYATAPMTLQPIVDRIGSGDAFAAGVLFGLCQKLGAQQTLEFALAAAALKHGLAGDLNMASALDVFSLLQSRNRDVQR